MSSTALYKFNSSFGTGSWNFNNSLGFLFTTFSQTVLTHLGIFDSAGDGITSPITVRVYEGSTNVVIASITFNGDGVLEDGFRYKALASPITLPALSPYTIAGGAFNTPNTGWQTGDGGSWSEVQIGGRVLSGVAVTGPVDALPTSPFSKFTKVGVSFKARDEGTSAEAELLFGATIQGTYSPTITLPITFSSIATGNRLLVGNANLPITFSTTITGESTGTIEASSTLPITIDNTSTAGLISDSGADLPITFSGVSTAGLSVLLPITFSGTVSGNLILDSSSTLPITFSASATVQGILNPSVNLPITFSGSVTGAGTTNLSVNLPISFSSSATADLTGEVSSTAVITFTASATGDLTGNGEATLPIIFSGTIDLSAYGEGYVNSTLTFDNVSVINGVLEGLPIDGVLSIGASFPPTTDGGIMEQASSNSNIGWNFLIIPPDTIPEPEPEPEFVPPYGTPVWITERDATSVMEIPFSLQFEFAPMMVDYTWNGTPIIAAHWVKHSDLRCNIGQPFVLIEPYFRLIPNSYRSGGRPYPPDSPLDYYWVPHNDPSGGWVELPTYLFDVEYGWRVVSYFGENSSLSQPSEYRLYVGGVTAFQYAPFVGGQPGIMGNVAYLSAGVPSGVVIPNPVANAIPNDWERTHGPTYGQSITGVIRFSCDYEEVFVNDPTPMSYAGGFQAGELGQATDDSMPPKLREYQLRPRAGGTRSISVETNLGDLTMSETIRAREATLWPSDYLELKVTTLAHSLGTVGAPVTNSASAAGSLIRGGLGVSGLPNIISNAGGSAGASGVVASTQVITGHPSPQYPFFIRGSGQTKRNGVQYSDAEATTRIMFPQTINIIGTLARLPSGVNTVPVDIIIHTQGAFSPTRTVSGVTGGFMETFSTDPRGLKLRVGTFGSTVEFPASGYIISTNAPITGEFGVFVSTPTSNMNLPRMGLRGKTWELFNAKLPASLNLHGDFSDTVAGFGVTLSIVSGSLRMTSSGGAIGFTARLGTSSKVSEHRYFKIRIRSVGSDDASVRLRYVGMGDLDWTFSTDGDGVWKEIELDSFEGFSGPTQYYTAPSLPPVNGFSNYWQFDCPVGSTIEVEYLRGILKTFELIETLGADFLSTSMWGTADGRAYGLPLDIPAIMTTLSGGWQFTVDSLPDPAKPWGSDPPYNANVGGGTYPDRWYFDADHFQLIHGLGLMLNPGLNTGVNLRKNLADIEDGIGLLAQDVMYRVSLYPGCGDVFGDNGAFGTTTNLYYGILLDAAVTTLEFKEDPDSDLIDIVALKDSDSSEQSRAHPLEPEGFSYMGAGIPQAVAHTLQYDPDDGSTSLPATLLNRSIYRTLWLKSGDAIELLCYNMTGEQKHHTYYVATNGDLRLIRVFQEVSGVIGAAPSVGTSKDTLIQAGHYSYPNAMELSGMYSSSELGDLRHGSGVHAVGAINKDTGHVQLFVSTDRGEAWRVETLSQTYSALQMVEHRGRVIATGWNGGSWYAFVGTPRAYTGVAGSGEYEWSNSSGLGTVVVATTKKSARLWVSEAGVINFAYLDNSGTPKILRCSSISKTGTGTWD